MDHIEILYYQIFYDFTFLTFYEYFGTRPTILVYSNFRLLFCIVREYDSSYILNQLQDSIYLMGDNHIFNLGFKSCLMVFVFI